MKAQLLYTHFLSPKNYSSIHFDAYLIGFQKEKNERFGG